LFWNFTQFFIHLFLFQIFLTLLCISGNDNCNEAANKRKPSMGNIFYNLNGQRGKTHGKLGKTKAPRASAVTVNWAVGFSSNCISCLAGCWFSYFLPFLWPNQLAIEIAICINNYLVYLNIREKIRKTLWLRNKSLL